MNVNITLTKNDILDQVYRITGYTGKKGGDLDKLASTEDDSILLGSYYDEATCSLADVVSLYGSVSDTAVTLAMPVNWKSGVQTSLGSAIKNYIINYMCMKWFALSKKDEVQYYANMADKMEANIKKLLTEREKPV